MYFEFKNLKNPKFEIVELIVSLVFALSCLLLFWFFPLSLKNDIVENFLNFLFFLFIFPAIYVRMILKKSLTEMYFGKFKNVSKTILPMIFSSIFGLLAIGIIVYSFLGESYYFLIEYLKISFKAFLVYEIFMAIFYLFFVAFSFGFINLVTKNFDKLNKILPVFSYFVLLLYLYPISFKNILINVLMISPVLFFRKIVNVSNSIWLLYFLILILNIILNATIIKIHL